MEDIISRITDKRFLFMAKRMYGKYEEAKEEKFKILPDKLYRYEKITDNRIKSLERNEIYMSGSEYFNDPFDCRGFYWDIESIYKNCSEDLENFSYSVEELRGFINGMMDNALRPVKITCFSEEKFNLPLWGNYADNRKGFCVEYNFKELGAKSELVDALFPVYYEEKRIDVTFALNSVIRCTITGEYHPVLPVLFYKNLIKHSSWSYEKEWRVVSVSKDNILKVPIKPTNIYLGDKISEGDIIKLKEVATKLSCGLIQLKPANFQNKAFVLEEILL